MTGPDSQYCSQCKQRARMDNSNLCYPCRKTYLVELPSLEERPSPFRCEVRNEHFELALTVNGRHVGVLTISPRGVGVKR